MSDGEHIVMPNGTSCWFYDTPDKPHSYWRHNDKTGKRGRRLTGVTTAAKPADFNSDGLMGWAAKTNCIGVAILNEQRGDDRDWLKSGETIWQELEDEKLTYEDVRDLASTKGTNIHREAFQALAMGRPMIDLDSLTEGEQGHAKAVMAFFLDHEPDTELVEQVVYSERLGVAGRLDWLGRINSRDGRGVIDLKTGNFISAAAHIQVGDAYVQLAHESGFGERVDWSLILKTYETGRYELIETETEPGDFEAAVTMYRIAGRINGAAAKARKERQAVAA